MTTQTTLTREALKSLASKNQTRYEEVDVPGFGTVGLRSQTHVQRSRRLTQLYGGGEDVQAMFGIYRIIDQVYADKSTPMFLPEDAAWLGDTEDGFLDPLLAALDKFNQKDEDPKKTDVLDKLSESSKATTD